MSGATVARLPAYLRVLVDAATAGATSIASDALAQASGNQPATVRRDLSSLSITGTRGVGYDVKHLVYEISVVLGVNHQWPVCIVGCGNLGRALANYDALAERGFPVRALIDIDPRLVGSTVAGLRVEALEALDRIIVERGIQVAVISTPAEAAQGVADRLTAAGVTSLLNFTATPLTVGPDVQVRGVDLATELQILSFYQQRSIGVRAGAGVPLGALSMLDHEAVG